jgi:hypothetical protein
MSVLKQETWDGVTAPAMPAGWNATGFATSAASPFSGVNALAYQVTSAGTYYCTWGTADTSGGNVIVSGYFNLSAGANKSFRWGLTARGSAATLSGSTSQYVAWIDWGSTAVGISRIVSGSETVLASLNPSLLQSTGGSWTYAYFVLNGTALSLALQRASDSFWLSSGGSWNILSSGQPSCLSVTDGSLAGPGYAGVYAVQTSASYAAYHDSWELDSILPNSPLPRIIMVNVPFQCFPPNQF